ncbi:MAG: hypothetical protein EA390_04440, partial [Balneolaceae bacterium]
ACPGFMPLPTGQLRKQLAKLVRNLASPVRLTGILLAPVRGTSPGYFFPLHFMENRQIFSKV